MKKYQNSSRTLKEDLLRSLNLFSKTEKIRISIITFLNISMSVLDLFAVGIVGIVAALTVRGVNSKGQSDRVSKILEYLHLENVNFKQQIMVLILLAVLLFTLKTFFSAFFTRKIYFHIARRGAEISTKLTTRLLENSLLFLEKKSIQERLYSLTLGTSVITNGIIGTLTSLVSDVALLLLLFLGILYVDPFVAFFTFAIFTLLAFLLYRLMNLKAQEIGSKLASKTVASNESYIEVLTTFREAMVRQTINNYIRRIRIQRLEIADIYAESRFMPILSKYVFEVALILVTLFVTWLQFTIYSSSKAIATLAVFFAASTRISPAILRIQQNMVTLKNNVGSCDPTFNLIEDLKNEKSFDLEARLDSQSTMGISDGNFIPEIEFKNVTFTYPSNKNISLEKINLKVVHGTMVGIVGPSGAGKSTLIDLMLGLISPDEGEVFLSGYSPKISLQRWPQKVGYVPQQTAIFNGSILSNLLLGLNREEISENNINQAIELSGLKDFVHQLPDGLETNVGDRGSKLSGGQKQRIGIARALITAPKLLILDEATSSLDAETENVVTSGVANLKGKVTLVIVAHRLSTVMKSDVIHYFERGSLIASGNFNNLRRKVKNFDKQAKLMGL